MKKTNSLILVKKAAKDSGVAFNPGTVDPNYAAGSSINALKRAQGRNNKIQEKVRKVLNTDKMKDILDSGKASVNKIKEDPKTAVAVGAGAGALGLGALIAGKANKAKKAKKAQQLAALKKMKLRRAGLAGAAFAGGTGLAAYLASKKKKESK